MNIPNQKLNRLLCHLGVMQATIEDFADGVPMTTKYREDIVADRKELQRILYSLGVRKKNANLEKDIPDPVPLAEFLTKGEV